MANRNHLKIGSFDVMELARRYRTPLYVYDTERIHQAYKQLDSLITYKPKYLHFAMMCNNRIEILKILKKLGSYIQANSPKEYKIAKRAGFTNDQISVATTNLGEEDMSFLIRNRAHLNLDSVEEIERYGRLIKKLGTGDTKIGVRVFTHIQALGKYVTNRAHDYKPRVGIKKEKFPQAKRLADKYGLKIIGLHGYVASNMLDLEPFIKLNEFLKGCAEQFPDLEYINFGSGFGLPPKKTSKGFDMKGYGAHIAKLMEEISKSFGRNIALRLEPGRSLLGDAGVLLMKVTNIKDMDSWTEVGVDAGFGTFARPYVYNWRTGGYHEVVAANKMNAKASRLYTICSNSVLQADYMAEDRKLPKLEVGDILAMLKTGAYGSVMSSNFPGMREAGEILIDKNKIKIITKTGRIS